MSVESLAKERIRALFDDGAFTELDRLGCDKVVTAFGLINGSACYAFSQNIESDGAAMCAGQASKIAKVYALAEKTGYPVVGIFDSNGAKLTDGVGAVSSFGELVSFADRLSGVVPQIAVIAGTCAASAAVWAQCSDVVVMSDDAKMFVTSPYILGNGIGDSSAATANGTAHITCKTVEQAVSTAREVLSYLPSNNISLAPESDCVPSAGAFPADSAYSAVEAVADEGSIIEIKKGFGSSVVTAFARLAGTSVGIVAAYGRLTAYDCAKAASFVGLCDCYSIPVINLLDTEGFESTTDSELNGSVKSAAILTKAYYNATCVKISVVLGKAYGPAFMTFASKCGGADMVFAVKNAVISPLAPEAAAAIIYNDRILNGEDKAAVLNDYILNDASAEKAASEGAVDDVIESGDVVAKLADALNILSSKRVSTLDKKHVVIS